MERMSTAERTAYGHTLSSMELDQLGAEVARLNRAIVAADAAIAMLATEPAAELEAFDLDDPEAIVFMARQGDGPAESDALRRARAHRRNLETQITMAGPVLAEARRGAGRKTARADLAKRSSRIQTAIAELHAHIHTARAAGARPLVDGQLVRDLEHALEVAAGK